MVKKISAIVSLVIIGILIVATIVLACNTVNYAVPCNKPTSIYVQYKGNTSLKVENEDHFNTIYDLMSSTSKEKAISALFNGNLNKKAEVVTASSTGKTLPTASAFYVRFKYNEAQELKYGNKAYKDEDGKTYSYEELVFTIEDTDGETEVKVYVIPTSSEPSVYSHYYLVDADFSSVYTFLSQHSYSD